MGGCLSSGREHNRQDGKRYDAQVLHSQAEDGEEAAVVKEVLSETPKPSSATREEDVGLKAQQTKLPGESFDEGKVSAYEIYKVKGEEDEGGGKVHIGDSLASTTKFLKKQRSLSGEFAFGGEQRLANGSMSSPSQSHVKRPERGSTLGRSLSGAEGYGLRRDSSGGGSRRRSGSPAATRSNGVTRTSSLRGTGRESPSTTMRGYVDHSGAWKAAELEIGEATRDRESLENPLVSLECFIFL